MNELVAVKPPKVTSTGRNYNLHNQQASTIEVLRKNGDTSENKILLKKSNRSPFVKSTLKPTLPGSSTSKSYSNMNEVTISSDYKNNDLSKVRK